MIFKVEFTELQMQYTEGRCFTSNDLLLCLQEGQKEGGREAGRNRGQRGGPTEILLSHLRVTVDGVCPTCPLALGKLSRKWHLSGHLTEFLNR